VLVLSGVDAGCIGICCCISNSTTGLECWCLYSLPSRINISACAQLLITRELKARKRSLFHS
jgi:hypothetical protein